jgi:two-component system nitrate/nitrite response regulator NarL
LSDREPEVLQLGANGYDGPAIAQHLLLSPATAKTHFLHVYEKLGVNERPAAVARALRQGHIS